MNKNLSKILSSTMGFAVIMGLLVPLFIGAQESAQTTRGFCTQLPTFRSRIEERLASKDDALAATRAINAGLLTERRNNREQKLADRRTQHDAKAQEIVAKLEAQATTDEQRAAVEAFKQTLKSAGDAQRAAMDGAIAQARTSTDQAMSGRQGEVDAARTTQKSSVSAAVDKAQASCDGGVTQQTIREAFITDMRAAGDAYKSTMQGINAKYTDIRRSTSDTFRAAVDKAVNDFKAAMEQAKSDLQEAFGTTPPPTE
jgi:hypothetical protein